MRFMMFIYPNIEDSDWMPDPAAVAAMTEFNNEMSRAGVLLAAEGLHPTSRGARVTGGGGAVRVSDGPFTEAREIIGGYWMLDVASREEAIEWARRCPAVAGPASVADFSGPAPVLEIRQVFEAEDFPPELRTAAGWVE